MCYPLSLNRRLSWRSDSIVISKVCTNSRVLTEVVVAGEGLGVTPPDLVETFQQQKERAVRAYELFEAFMKEKGVPLNGGGDPARARDGGLG